MIEKAITMRSNKKSDMTDLLLKKYPNVEVIDTGKVCNNFGAGGKKYYQRFWVRIKDELKGLVTKKKARQITILDEILKETPIETRLRVLFSMEWLTMNIFPERQTTDAEDKKAHKWAMKMVRWVMADFRQWEKDGRPKQKKMFKEATKIPKDIDKNIKEMSKPKKKKPIDPLDEKISKRKK